MNERRIFFMFFLFALSLLLYFINNLPKQVAPQFITKPTRSLTTNTPAYFKSQTIPEPASLLMSHSATFTVLSNGELLAFWFAGSKEGRTDVKIWSSRYDGHRWSTAKSIVSPNRLSKGLAQYVKKIGNPSVYRDANEVLHLFVVSVGAVGGWAVSNLNHLYSYDHGNTWSNPKRLILSPFFNISTLDRTRGIALEGGGFYLPVYYEFIHTYPELLWFDNKGDFIRQIRMTSETSLIQPAVVASSPLLGQSFLRNHSNPDKILYMQSTNDAGLTWSKPIATNLHNHDASIAAIKLSTRQLLMVRNLGQDRHTLVLSISTDGLTWSNTITLEKTTSASIGYPAIEEHDGIIDILYSWEYKKIKHVRFNLSWLEKNYRKNKWPKVHI